MTSVASIAREIVTDKGLEASYELTRGVGVFIAVEGIDGSGISTHSRLLVEALNMVIRGSKTIYTKEPTYSPIGFLIWMGLRYRIKETGLMDPRIAALLFAADRLFHLHYEPLKEASGVLDALRRGYSVVTDRYKYSSHVYQVVSGADEEWVKLVNAYAPPPHILVVLDVDSETAFRRIMSERLQTQLFEAKEFLEKSRLAFRRLAESLSRSPEYCAGRDEPLWAKMLNMDADAIWPRPHCYPRVVVVEETREGYERALREVAEELITRVLRELSSLGIIKST